MNVLKYPIHSIQIISHISIINEKNYHVNLSKAYNISTKFVTMMLEGTLILKT
jgi:hypothetical protein